jgi:death-on-curing protein
MIEYLTAEEILLIHHQLIERYGGSHGVRDVTRIESVIAAPQQTSFGQELYPSPHDKAAVYLRGIIADHPFVDGNKRTGITSGIMFLKKNGCDFEAKLGELEDFAVRVATDHLTIEAIAEWLKAHS